MTKILQLSLNILRYRSNASLRPKGGYCCTICPAAVGQHPSPPPPPLWFRSQRRNPAGGKDGRGQVSRIAGQQGSRAAMQQGRKVGGQEGRRTGVFIPKGGGMENFTSFSFSYFVQSSKTAFLYLSQRTVKKYK